MPDSLNLVFQYFLAAGTGLGLGLALTLGGSYLVYKKVSNMKMTRRGKR